MVQPERAQQAAVEGEAALEIRNHEIDVVEVGSHAAQRYPPLIATIRSIGTRARSAISGSTFTTGCRSRSASRSFGSVIIFMYWHTAARLAGTNRLARVLDLERVQHAGLGGHDERVRVGLARVLEHAAGGEHVGVLGVDVARGHVLHDRGRAAALGVDQELGARVGLTHVGDVAGPDARVHVALAGPDVHPPPGDLLDVGAEEHVGAEEDLGVVAVLAPDVLHDLHRVGRRAADVALRLDLGGGSPSRTVHDGGVRVLCLGAGAARRP